MQVNRNMSTEDIDNTVEQLKEHLENIMELVRTESDEFEQQFRG
jgi:predicted ATP-grasp superfamily ATP-dependent carboligase